MLKGDNQRDILLILLSLGTNYPILKEYGLGTSKLLFVIVGEGQTQKAKSLLSDNDTPSVDEFMSIREVKRIFMDANSTFITYSYSYSRRGQEFMPFLEMIARTGDVAGFKINALPLVIAEGIPLGYDLQRSFTVFLEGDLTEVDIDLEEVVPLDEELAVVEDKIQTILPIAASPDEKMLLAAACFSYPIMKRAGKQQEFENLLEHARRLATLNEENQDTSQLEVLFINLLYDWQRQTDFHRVYELPYLEMKTLEWLKESMFFDTNYIYMHEEVFKKIVKPLLNLFSLPVVKKALVEISMICPDQAGTYTAKMGYYNVVGQYQRIRMLRFSADKLERPGELGFLELCRCGKGEDTYGDIANSVR